LSQKHNFPSDFPAPEAAIGVLTYMFSAPDFYCVVAERDGQLVGSNCLDERSVIVGVGPITVVTGGQNSGVGRALMRDVIERAAATGAAGVRLVQAAFHNRSMSLYTSLGFDVREPLSCMQGRTTQRTVPGCTVRPATTNDLHDCNRLSRRVHGFDRGEDLAQSIERDTAKVVERGGGITGYTSMLAFFGHTTARRIWISRR
jgi:hypothetical protein